MARCSPAKSEQGESTGKKRWLLAYNPTVPFLSL
jgi:hypothetical protein